MNLLKHMEAALVVCIPEKPLLDLLPHLQLPGALPHLVKQGGHE